MDLNIIEKQLNKDCLENIYSFIKPSKEMETLLNFYKFIQEQKIKWFSNKLETLKVGFYYIDKYSLENTQHQVYFKVIKITKCFITISKFIYNHNKKEFRNVVKDLKIKIKKIEDDYSFDKNYELKSSSKYYDFDVKFNDLIEYDKPPEFIKHINYKTTSPHMYFNDRDESLMKIKNKFNVSFDYKIRYGCSYSSDGAGVLCYRNKYLYYDSFKEEEELKWIFTN